MPIAPEKLLDGPRAKFYKGTSTDGKFKQVRETEANISDCKQFHIQSTTKWINTIASAP
jgi:hypothetical protein